ncbi:MAG: hypothetical protein ACYSVY_28860 [Planctomycetota bacterium]
MPMVSWATGLRRTPRYPCWLSRFPGGSETAFWDFHAVLWTEGRGMVDLGTLGGDFGVGNDINERGEVVGHSETASGRLQAFLPARQSQCIPHLYGAASRFPRRETGDPGRKLEGSHSAADATAAMSRVSIIGTATSPAGERTMPPSRIACC